MRVLLFPTRRNPLPIVRKSGMLEILQEIRAMGELVRETDVSHAVARDVERLDAGVDTARQRRSTERRLERGRVRRLETGERVRA